MRRLFLLLLAIVVACAPLTAPGPVVAKPKKHKEPIVFATGRLDSSSRARTPTGPASVKDRYIVVLRNSVHDPLVVASRFTDEGVEPTHVYMYAINGFAALIPPDALAMVTRDPDVVSVIPDEIIRAQVDTAPTGIKRIGATENRFAKIDGVDLPRVDVDIAILDTGVSPHPDLNLYGSANCVLNSPTNDDENGHGTGVAGVAAALDNGFGVTGVAPGARIWNIKIGNATGTSTTAWELCGVDFVRQYAPGTNKPVGDIEVANESFEGPDYVLNSTCTYATHKAYCDAVAAGVTFVVSAGNNATEANRTSPATFDEVITVSALADSDGRPGGLGPATSAGADDTFASFSNFGADIDIAAPGVDILTTVTTTGDPRTSDPSGYKMVSGTSFASPHVAGAAAVYIAEHGRVGPTAVKAGLLAQREQFAMPNDPDGVAEGIVNLQRPDTTPPEISINVPNSGPVIKKPLTINITASDEESGVKNVSLRYCKGASCTFASGKLIGTDASAPYAIKWAKLPKNGKYTLVAQATDNAGNTKLSAPLTVTVKVPEKKKKKGNH